MTRRSGGRSGGRRDYPRTARLNELLREVLAEELERLDDDRLSLVSITSIDVDPELSRARVFVSAFEDTDLALEALDEHRGQLKRAIGSQARIRRTPELVFLADPAIEHGTRVEEILRDLADDETENDAHAENDAADEPDDGTAPPS